MFELDDFLKYVDDNRYVVNYIKVEQNGETIAYYGRLPLKTRFNLMSASKSFVSVAVGIAMEEGLVSLTDKMCDYFPEYMPDKAGEFLPEITLKDLLTMQAGNKEALFFNDDELRYNTKDWIQYFFNTEFSYKPGTHFLYSNFNTYMASCMVEKKAGMNLKDYLQPRLFDKMGVHNIDWTCCPKGHVHAANGLYLTIDEFSGFGNMLLNQGNYNGHSIVSKEYLKEATRQQVEDVNYGYQFWINPDNQSFRADGKYGQYCIVMPEKNAVVTTMACEDVKLFDKVWEMIAEKVKK